MHWFASDKISGHGLLDASEKIITPSSLAVVTAHKLKSIFEFTKM